MTTVHCLGDSHIWMVLGSYCHSEVRLQHAWSSTDFIGRKVGQSGATAFGLMKVGSRTNAGRQIVEFLDGEPDDHKTVLLSFGEVDVASHIGNHLGEDRDRTNALARYAEYVRTMVAGRRDVAQVMLASTVPRSRGFRGPQNAACIDAFRRWNSGLREMCATEGFVYVDWWGPLADADGHLLPGLARDEGGTNECHVSENGWPLAAAAVLSALREASISSPMGMPTEKPQPSQSAPAGLILTDAERRALAAVLDRQRTAHVAHGGLKGLLGLSSDDADALLGFLRRACG